MALSGPAAAIAPTTLSTQATEKDERKTPTFQDKIIKVIQHREDNEYVFNIGGEIIKERFSHKSGLNQDYMTPQKFYEYKRMRLIAERTEKTLDAMKADFEPTEHVKKLIEKVSERIDAFSGTKRKDQRQKRLAQAVSESNEVATEILKTQNSSHSQFHRVLVEEDLLEDWEIVNEGGFVEGDIIYPIRPKVNPQSTSRRNLWTGEGERYPKTFEKVLARNERREERLELLKKQVQKDLLLQEIDDLFEELDQEAEAKVATALEEAMESEA